MSNFSVLRAFETHAPAARRFPLRAVLLGVATVFLTASLHAAFRISVTSSPASVRSQQYDPGSSIKLSIATIPAPTGQLEWFRDDKPISGAFASSYTLNSATTLDSGNYRARITSGGSVTWSDNTITLNVIASPTPPIDSTFNAELPSDLSISSVFRNGSDGSLVVQGFPSSNFINPGNAYRAIRFRADGSRDTSLDITLGSNAVLAVLPDGRLITSRSPFRLTTTGSADALALPAGFDSSKALDVAVVQPDGKLLVAQAKNLARLNADGSFDATFATNLTFDAISSLTLDASSRILVYATWYDIEKFVSYGILDRLTTTGARDTSFHRREASRQSYYPSVLPGGGYLLEYFRGNLEGPLFLRLNDDGTEVASWSVLFGYHPAYASLVVDPTQQSTFYTRDLHRFRITSTGATADSTFYAGINGRLLTVLTDGKLLALKTTTSLDGKSQTSLVRLRTTDITPALAPTVSVDPFDVTPTKGATLTFSSTIDGSDVVGYQWLALDGQRLPADTMSARLVISNFQAANLGRYQLRVTTSGGTTVLSNVTRAVTGALPTYLANLSGRAMTGKGENTVIAGLAAKISAGARGLNTLLRGGGPVLRPFAVTNFLPNPALSVYNTAGTLVANNDQWSTNPTTKDLANAAGAIPFEATSNDAALTRTFGTENATLHLLEQDGRSGIGLLEIYRVPDTTVSADLTNLSFRARTAPGEETAIVGFVIADPQGFDRPARVLLRAVGPTLGKSGIEHPLENPVLTVYDSNGQIVAQNDNWPSHFTAEVTEYDRATTQVGAFPLPQFSYDAGLLLDLPAGAYSMHATGGTGVVLLEIYLVR